MPVLEEQDFGVYTSSIGRVMFDEHGASFDVTATNSSEPIQAVRLEYGTSRDGKLSFATTSSGQWVSIVRFRWFKTPEGITAVSVRTGERHLFKRSGDVPTQ